MNYLTPIVHYKKEITMKFQALFLLLILIIISSFVALNWEAINTPTDLSIGFTNVIMPLGMVLLIALASITILFLFYIAYLQGSALLDTRRLTKDLQTQRKLADEAEASRFTELRQFIEFSFAKEVTLNTETRSQLIARMDQLEEMVKLNVKPTDKPDDKTYVGEFEKLNYVKKL
jgi:hypothetical protein